MLKFLSMDDSKHGKKDVLGVPISKIPEVTITGKSREVMYENMSSLPKFSELNGVHVPNELINKLKVKVARKVLDFIKPNMVVGIGTGTTINELIPLMTNIIDSIDGVASSSRETTTALKKFNIEPMPISAVRRIHLYIDGADQINPNFEMIKGGGGALTGEKILTRMAEYFICIVDTRKIVLDFSSPIPIEVIPMALSLVTNIIEEMGGRVTLRENYVTEYGNFIIDVGGLDTMNPADLEVKLNSIEGVVTNGLFTAVNRADMLLVSSPDGVLEYRRLNRSTNKLKENLSFMEEDS